MIKIATRGDKLIKYNKIVGIRFVIRKMITINVGRPITIIIKKKIMTSSKL